MWIRCCSSSRRDTPLLFVVLLLLFNSISELVMLWLLLVVLFESVAMCGTIVGGTLALHSSSTTLPYRVVGFRGDCFPWDLSCNTRQLIVAQVHTRHYLFLFLALSQQTDWHTRCRWTGSGCWLTTTGQLVSIHQFDRGYSALSYNNFSLCTCNCFSSSSGQDDYLLCRHHWPTHLQFAFVFTIHFSAATGAKIALLPMMVIATGWLLHKREYVTLNCLTQSWIYKLYYRLKNIDAVHVHNI